MSAIVESALLYAVTLLLAVTGFAVLRRLGVEAFPAWLGARTAGMVSVAFPAWWLGALGVSEWRGVGTAVLVASCLWGAPKLVRCRGGWSRLLGAELIFVLGAAAVLIMRLQHPEILGTEKPMDLGVLTTLARSQAFPPDDFWLAGEALAYYYWGALLWTVPLELSGSSFGYGYNLVVAALGGGIFALAWAVGRALGGGQASGALAGFLVTFAGTWDGLWQLMSGRTLGELDLWRSSRQVPDAITEFPLFSLWLGDLHPHLLVLPVLLLALLLAHATGRGAPRVAQLCGLAILVGVASAANPWSMPVAFVAVLLVVLTADGEWRWPWAHGGRRWMLALPLAAGALASISPFLIAYDPPYSGLARVRAQTPVSDLLLYAGGLLLPALGLVYRGVTDWASRSRQRAALLSTVVVCATLAGMVSGKPLAVALLGLAAALAWLGARTDSARERPALMLAFVGTTLLAVPELVYVIDPYGDQWHRMNTVFKAYYQAWVLLAVAWPALLASCLACRPRRRAATVLLVVAALPHFLATMAQSFGKPLGLDGLAWMSRGERALVRFLADSPPGTSIIEAVGGPYTRHGRIATASGVPTYLGWPNHERLWRGPTIEGELAQRQRLVAEVYGSSDGAKAWRLVQQAAATYVVVGGLERAQYSTEGVERLIRAGRIVLEEADTLLLEFATPERSSGPVPHSPSP